MPEDVEPVPGDGELELPHDGQTKEGSDEMAENVTDPGNLSVAMTGLANNFGNIATLVGGRAAQLSGDSQAMWAIAMTSPTVMAAQGMRLASESGGGRTRIESNTPASSQIVGS